MTAPRPASRLLAPVAGGGPVTLDTHMRTFKNSWRRGLPMMTPKLMAVLIRLRTAQEDDSPFIPLADVHKRTINALVERDWVFADPGSDGWRYKITARGLKALKVYEPMVKRTDGLCPRCCERPRGLRRTGEPKPYCTECLRQLGRRTYRLGLYKKRPEGLCARCEKRPRYVASSGKVYSYCQHCKNLLHRREHKRERKEILTRILAGEHVACRRDGCDKTRYVSGKSVQDYCYEHYREWQNAYNRQHPRIRTVTP